MVQKKRVTGVAYFIQFSSLYKKENNISYKNSY